MILQFSQRRQTADGVGQGQRTANSGSKHRETRRNGAEGINGTRLWDEKKRPRREQKEKQLMQEAISGAGRRPE